MYKVVLSLGALAIICMVCCSTPQAAEVTVQSVAAAPGDVNVAVQVNVTGGEAIAGADQALVVGDGGPDIIGGIETTIISSVDSLTGTIWAGGPVLTQSIIPNPIPTQSAAIAGITLDAATVAADGLLMTFFLDLTDPSFLGRVGEVIPLNADLNALSALFDANGGALVGTSYVGGTLTVTPEPSSLLLGLGAVFSMLVVSRVRRRRQKA